MMTADERIESLLSAFGQTISDLPYPEGSHSGYKYKDRWHAGVKAIEWRGSPTVDCELDYICHLADIIDRMEIALETARRWGPCSKCHHFYSDEEPEEGTCQCSHKYNEFDDIFAIDDLFLT